ncbi:HU family DNA-binding protein [Sulfurovum sp. NBC37-1]|uniref:HU family DNA-binding protein n=1 Tax=Sulfurovum sp. (strain NBC37-1) TaxID=387093 RepID=UPI0001587960|nr:HU family DNA-binding protein [Sulfurovum sp. NBC37-1]BAF72674.1 hypothetical protein SUN_1727 [Sulfurovum sp. NBC37-1]
MKIDELLKVMMAENEKLFSKIPEKKAKKIVRATIKSIGEQLDEKEEGKITIQGLGTFRKKIIEKEGATREKIIFKQQKKKSNPEK